MILLSLFILQVLLAAFCFDIEVQGKVKVANKYLAVLRQPSEMLNLILSYLPEKIVGKGKLPKALETAAKPYLRTSNEAKEKKRHKKLFTSTLSPSQTIKQNANLDSFHKHLQIIGTSAIQEISKKTLVELDIKKNITPIVVVVTDDYKEQFQNYYDYAKKYQYDIDINNLYLDMVETSSRWVFEGEKKILNDIIMQENQNYHERYKKMTNELLKYSYLYKKYIMKSLCQKYKVCKEYPAISDYGAEIISEILLLSDSQLITFLKILSKIFKQNEKIIARVIENEDRRLIMETMHDFTIDLYETRIFFALVKAVITQRFKRITSDDEEFVMKTKATRLLLDILDKALNIEDDVITIDADNFLQAVKNWAAHNREDIEEILEDFTKNLIIRLENNLTKSAKKEIKSLITVIMRETTKDSEHLIKFGSNYLKNKDFDPDIDIKFSD